MTFSQDPIHLALNARIRVTIGRPPELRNLRNLPAVLYERDSFDFRGSHLFQLLDEA